MTEITKNELAVGILELLFGVPYQTDTPVDRLHNVIQKSYGYSAEEIDVALTVLEEESLVLIERNNEGHRETVKGLTEDGNRLALRLLNHPLLANFFGNFRADS